MIELLYYLFHTLMDWDASLTLWVNGMHTNYWDNFMEMYSMRFVWLPFYLSFAFVLIRYYSLKFAVFCIAAAVILLVMNDQLCSSVIRSSVERLRPSNLDNPISAFIHIVDGHRGGRRGFPSAHATNSWGATFFVIYIFRRRLLGVTMVLWAFLTCYSRLYLGVHYLGDTLGGLLLGLVNATLVCYLFRMWKPEMIKAFKQNSPGAPSFYLPVMMYLATVAGMLLLAFFVDPP